MRIIVRADSGFAREGFLAWCESHGVHYLIGLAKNNRLLKKIGNELVQLKLLKIGTHLTLSVRCIRLHFASACPYQDVFHHVWQNLQHYPLRR